MVVSVVGGTSHDTNARESLFSVPLQPGVKSFAHATGQVALQSVVCTCFGPSVYGTVYGLQCLACRRRESNKGPPDAKRIARNK